MVHFDPTNLTSADADIVEPFRLVSTANEDSQGNQWVPILGHNCDFPPQTFEEVSLNLIRNPNINSSLLFRADILYDDFEHEATGRRLLFRHMSSNYSKITDLETEIFQGTNSCGHWSGQWCRGTHSSIRVSCKHAIS